MIDITVQKDIGFSLTGHAGYASKGQDIVCAGVSALWFMAYSADLECHDTKERRTVCAHGKEDARIVNAICDVFDAMQDRYPENIRITYGDIGVFLREKQRN